MARWQETRKYVFLFNFTARSVKLQLPREACVDVETQKRCEAAMVPGPFVSRVFVDADLESSPRKFIASLIGVKTWQTSRRRCWRVPTA